MESSERKERAKRLIGVFVKVKVYQKRKKSSLKVYH